MKLYQDTSGIDKVVDVATKYVNMTDKVVNLVRDTVDMKRKVGGLKTSTKVGLLVGGALALCLFPLRLAYDSITGEGEYKSLLVSVKHTQRPERTTQGRTHDVAWEAFPTVRVKPADIKPCDLPPAQKKDAVRAVPVQAYKIQKVQPCVPVKLKVQEESK